ncbi:DUF4019 domain-containing protein [Glaciimonas sp. Gout2]|uniref:DUF4019 domain-containing protein n=1 Tax=unclassified Glaciimonas TaxID=2644401 RepID=UPI002B225E5D|nr:MULTISPECIES: DUF4019 domain-containing protein [unclassified Glaciimonas]MEB0013515.1 DUF4019 domain-containing protein [Glaciimonas sp. Cout2]MEB0081594.1 DUF4019 domain-containing protein [Glaciimonas sp. Gout2]
MNQSLASKQYCAYVLLAVGVMVCNGNAYAQTLSLDGAVAAASQWATLADANQAERMWTASGPVMQKSINKEDWAKYLTNLRNDLGSLNGREWAEVVRVGQPTNLPKGDYVNVVFSSRFTKSPAGEAVSLMYAAGRWVPVGYVVHKVQPIAANGAPASATTK